MNIELPQVGESVTEGMIGKWLVSVGDRVEKYDPLVEVVTDKVNMEFPSPESGVLTKIIAQEGETVPMGTAIAEMAADGEGAAESAGAGAAGQAEAQRIDTLGTYIEDASPVGPTGSANVPMQGDVPLAADTADAPRQPRQRYSPAVRRLAEQHGIDLARVTGTGMGGRVTLQDVRGVVTDVGTTAAASGDVRSEDEAGEQAEHMALTPVRRMIAANMVRSATEIPQAWSMVEVDVSGLVAVRESLKADYQERTGAGLTFLPFFVAAAAACLREHALLNSSWEDDRIVLHREINIGVAVATPEGLMVPVVQGADGLGVAEIAARLDSQIERARAGKLELPDVRGGTFTVNNTGALGSVASRPLVNPPQAAILATEAIVKRPVIVGDAIAIRSVMNLGLTFDHRIMDGAEAGAFLQAVKARLESISDAEGFWAPGQVPGPTRA